MLSRATKTDATSWERSGRGEEPSVKSGGWVVAFTGRTQRDVVGEGKEHARSIYAREFSV